MRQPLEEASERWRLIPLRMGDSAQHVALGDILVRDVAKGGPTVWWHATREPTVLVGPTGGTGPADVGPSRKLVRRRAGGGVVLAGPDVLGLDVALPRHHRLLTGDIVEDYRWLGEVWVAGLRILGIDARVVGVSEARDSARASNSPMAHRYATLACFGSVSPYEVLAGGRKVVGLAQVRRGGGVLLTSAVHLSFDGGAIAAVLPIPDELRPEVAERLHQIAVGLDEVVSTQLTMDDIIDAFHQALTSYAGVRLTEDTWPRGELQRLDGTATRPTSTPGDVDQLPL